MLALYRALIALRKSRSEISQSDAVFFDKVPSGVLAYRFVKDGKCTLVILNMGNRQRTIRLDSLAGGTSGLRVALTTYNRVKLCVEDGALMVPAGLGVVLTN